MSDRDIKPENVTDTTIVIDESGPWKHITLKPDDDPPSCKHISFSASVSVHRLEDTGQFLADVKIECAECRAPMQFLGLPVGLNLFGAAMDVLGQEARLAIAPAGTVPLPLGLDALRGEPS